MQARWPATFWTYSCLLLVLPGHGSHPAGIINGSSILVLAAAPSLARRGVGPAAIICAMTYIGGVLAGGPYRGRPGPARPGARRDTAP